MGSASRHQERNGSRSKIWASGKATTLGDKCITRIDRRVGHQKILSPQFRQLPIRHSGWWSGRGVTWTADHFVKRPLKLKCTLLKALSSCRVRLCHPRPNVFDPQESLRLSLRFLV